MTDRCAVRRTAWRRGLGGLLLWLTAAMLVAVGAQTDRLPPPPAGWVTAFDMERCVQTHFPEATTLRRSAAWGAGLQVVLVEPGRRERFEVTVGVFGSAPEATAAAEALLRDIPVRCSTGSLTGARVGNACWSLSASGAGEEPRSAAPSLMLFHRDNVLVRILGSPRERVQDAAERVDRDLVEGAAHVQRGAAVTRPSLVPAATPAGLAVGDEVQLELTVSPGLGAELFYTYALEGGVLLGGDPPRPLSFRAHTPGEHWLRFCVVDEQCRVSPVAQIAVTVVE